MKQKTCYSKSVHTVHLWVRGVHTMRYDFQNFGTHSILYYSFDNTIMKIYGKVYLPSVHETSHSPHSVSLRTHPLVI